MCVPLACTQTVHCFPCSGNSATSIACPISKGQSSASTACWEEFWDAWSMNTFCRIWILISQSKGSFVALPWALCMGQDIVVLPEVQIWDRTMTQRHSMVPYVHFLWGGGGGEKLCVRPLPSTDYFPLHVASAVLSNTLMEWESIFHPLPDHPCSGYA